MNFVSGALHGEGRGLLGRQRVLRSGPGIKVIGRNWGNAFWVVAYEAQVEMREGGRLISDLYAYEQNGEVQRAQR